METARKVQRVRILIHGLNYAPDLVGIPKYTTEMAEWLAAKGHEVRVATAPPYYPAWKRRDGYPRLIYKFEESNSVKLVRCPIYVPRIPTGARRLLHLASFAVSSFPVMLWQALFFRPQIIISVAPALVSAPVSLIARLLCRARTWLHIQDFELDTAFALGLLRGNIPKRIALAGERWLLRSFDQVSSISPQMLNTLLEKGCHPDRVFEFRNWVDTSAIGQISDDNKYYRAKLGVGADGIILLYSGTIGRKQGIDIIVDAARILSDRTDIRFLICGDGPGREDILERAAGLANIDFLHIQPEHRLNDLLNAADIHLLPQVPTAADLVLPSKLSGMLASGRPIIALAAQGTGIEAEISGNGIAVDPGNVRAFTSAIELLANDSVLRKRYGENARRRAMTVWRKEIVLGAFEKHIENKILKSPRSRASG